jgi:putative transposase
MESGIQYRTGRLRRPNADIVKVNLLPHTEATITEKGLKLFNCYYTCKEALDWGWFEGNYKGPRKVTVAYDSFSANVIYLRPNDSYASFVKAALATRSRAFQDLTIWDVWIRNDINADVAATSKLRNHINVIELSIKTVFLRFVSSNQTVGVAIGAHAIPILQRLTPV